MPHSCPQCGVQCQCDERHNGPEEFCPRENCIHCPLPDYEDAEYDREMDLRGCEARLDTRQE